jgi:hypothetical protein
MSGYGRPSPPTSRRRIVSPRPPEPPPPSGAEPDRAFVENAPPQETEQTLRSAPTAPENPPEKAGAEMAGKKRRPRASGEQREIALARVRALVKAGEQRKKAIDKVAKELGYSAGALNKWMVDAGHRERQVRSDRVVETRPAKKRAQNGASRRVEAAIAEHLGAVELGPLDVALDLLELADRARSSLGAASRKRLLTELEKRLA